MWGNERSTGFRVAPGIQPGTSVTGWKIWVKLQWFREHPFKVFAEYAFHSSMSNSIVNGLKLL